MGGCCAQRSKYEGQQDDQVKLVNQLPTYENISKIYNELELPKPIDIYLQHKKERLLFMIINLLRVRPKIFMQQMQNFKIKCNMRQKPKNLVFIADDVQTAMEFLFNYNPVQPLEMNKDLCQLCRNPKDQSAFQLLKHNTPQRQGSWAADEGYDSSSSLGEGKRNRSRSSSRSRQIQTSREQTKEQLRQLLNKGEDKGKRNIQQLQISRLDTFTSLNTSKNGPYNTQPVERRPKIKGAKEMVIDFICREDLVLTTLKEFFEIFISSIKKDQVFHTELLNPQFKYIGLSMQFSSQTSISTLKIFLAQSVEKNE
ncbi:UNKNOWN [Stylonychia lemnae]|uniref:Uncharacterized protein n=1 Tax=Stylonychia lemnae TaxID=5949 RepID=A0A077ZYY4_STYLE|nr:UNKNOWN [Stylonychia lemnae]|eukprot:CDW75125.1 UNKNOWN [Stylonychia lemnae]